MISIVNTECHVPKTFSDLAKIAASGRLGLFWNTMKLGEVVNTRAASGTHIAPDLLAHVSPLGWEHINLTGEYRWPKSLA